MMERLGVREAVVGSLAGKTVVNTRATHQAEDLSVLLRARGAEVLLYPCIDIALPEDLEPLDSALRAAVEGAFTWLLLTSANAVRALAERLEALGEKLSATNAMVVAIGPATAEATSRTLGLAPRMIPEEYSGEGLASALESALASEPGIGKCRVLLPQADLARPFLSERLSRAGIDVTSVTAYRTVRGAGGVDLVGHLVRSGHDRAAGSDGKTVDAVVLASPSAARNLVERLKSEGGSERLLDGVCLACIGRVTAEAARGLGLRADICPTEHTLPALVQALCEYYEATSNGSEEP